MRVAEKILGKIIKFDILSGKWCPCTATLSGSLARMAIFNRKATEFAFHDE